MTATRYHLSAPLFIDHQISNIVTNIKAQTLGFVNCSQAFALFYIILIEI